MAFRIEDLFVNYLRHNEINEYLDYLAEKYPDTVSVSTCGLSYEGRALKSIRISTPRGDPKKSSTKRRLSMTTENQSCGRKKSTLKRSSKSAKTPSRSIMSSKSIRESPSLATGNSKSESPVSTKTSNETTSRPKPVVLIDGGIHAREWISVATAIYCIYQLTECSKDNKRLLNRLDFVIVPLVNPDGYEYSHTHSRYWRKTRKPILGCKHIGTDCNRNFDFHWTSACSRASKLTFRGTCPFSEPETRVLKTLMHSLKDDCKFYLTLHAYAQAFMYPWGYTKSLPTNWLELHRLAQTGHNAIKKETGRLYRCGTVSLLIKRTAAGGSPDYAMGTVKIPYAMTMELSGAGYGFDPPRTEIRGLVAESWVGIRAMSGHIAQLVA